MGGVIGGLVGAVLIILIIIIIAYLIWRKAKNSPSKCNDSVHGMFSMITKESEKLVPSQVQLSGFEIPCVCITYMYREL